MLVLTAEFLYIYQMRESKNLAVCYAIEDITAYIKSSVSTEIVLVGRRDKKDQKDLRFMGLSHEQIAVLQSFIQARFL